MTPWVTWGDIAADGFSTGSRKSCGWGRAWCSGQESQGERVWRHCPSRTPTAQGGQMPGGMLGQAGAGRPGFLSGELRTHWRACSLAADRQPVTATPSPHSPQQAPSQPQGWWDSPGIAALESGRFACVRVLFALLGWTCLYLLNKPGDTAGRVGWQHLHPFWI